MKVWVRNLGSTSRTLQEALTSATKVDAFGQLAKGTGRGPFIELPKFSPIGSPGHLLKMQIPVSSTVNIRSGSIIALNGDLDRIRLSRAANPHFQLLETMAPATMVMSGNQNEAYHVIEASLERPWTILRPSNITAWCGYDLELTSFAVTEQLQAYKTTGRGTLVVSGSRSLYAVKLEAGEELEVLPDNLVAIQNDQSLPVKSLTRRKSAGPSTYLRVPEVVSITVEGWQQAIARRWHLLVQESGLQSVLKRLSEYRKRTGAKRAYLQVQGPAELVISER